MPTAINKFLFVLLVIIVAIALVLLFWQFPSRETAPPPATNLPPAAPSLTEAIDSIEIADLEKEFQAVDADIDKL